ncbi:MAG TPA: hypothetical protein VJS17_05750 [Pyrinomonadaceae bacterium]|nr:hypothetical protein [Pyrinomonadaceae bacterium]
MSVLLFLTLASTARAQAPCGIVDVDGPSQVDLGKPMVLKAKTTMLNTTKPEFKWTLSVGTITTGQGTDEITVDTLGLGGQVVTVTVELSGAPAGCNKSSSKAVQVKPSPPTMCAFDSYGDIKFEDEQARLDNLAIQLMNQPLSSGYIMIFAGQVTYENEAEGRLRRAKSYLTDVRETDPNRIVTIDCGFSQALTTKLWIVPLEAAPPPCESWYEIPFSQVKFTKPRPKSSKKSRRE